MQTACFIVLLVIAGFIGFDVVDTRLRRRKSKKLSEQEKKRIDKAKREINNFLSYTGDIQE